MSTIFMSSTWRVAPLTPTRIDTPMGSISVSWRNNNDGGAMERAAEDAVRLIAKAPDMLDMLIQCRKEFAGLPHSLGYDFTHLPKLDALIAEAAGERS